MSGVRLVLNKLPSPAGNNGFDFVHWFFCEGQTEQHQSVVLLNFGETCRAINRIKDFYEENYGNAETLLEDSTAKSILKHYEYVNLPKDIKLYVLCKLYEI